MNKKDYYLKIVEWSAEDQCYIGSIPGWIGRCCHGDNEQDVYSQLCRILDEWIEIYEKDNIPLPAVIVEPTGILENDCPEKSQLEVDDCLHKTPALHAF